ncbi:SET9 [Acrasis kona]|uniref:SET9 n=1 Tax=Acrasis kona TaxID=1008807 RepID=A0AAW2ZHZ3_9EUKA
MSKKTTGRDKKSPVTQQGNFNAEAFFNNSNQTINQTPLPESDEMFNAMELEQQFLQPKKEFNEQEAVNYLKSAFKDTARNAKKYEPNTNTNTPTTTATNQDNSNSSWIEVRKHK